MSGKLAGPLIEDSSPPAFIRRIGRAGSIIDESRSIVCDDGTVQMSRHFFSMGKILALALACALAAINPTRAIVINISYQFDTQGFFDLQPRREALEAAASAFEVFTDNLAAITPGTRYNVGTPDEFADTWTAQFEHPGQAGNATVVDLTIASDTMIIYAGGKNLSGSTLGFGGPGGFNANGITSFINAVSTRGQPNTTGSNPTDYGRWGGGITFDTLTSNGQPRTWHTDFNTLPAPGAVDLYTVAVHELGHLFGFVLGTAQTPLSFDTRVDEANDLFVGPKVEEVYGGPAPMAADGSAHWHASVMSTVNGSSQIAVMGPSISPGLRRYFTALDYAAMADIGWQVPESAFDMPVPGDYDGDGNVDASDLAVWQRTFWSTSNLAADGNGSLRVDAADYTIWRDHLGASSGVGTTVAAVPEPTGMAIAILCSLLLVVSRRSLMTRLSRR